MKQLSGILFDFNGTLFFDSDMHIDAFRLIFPKFGQPVPSDEMLMTQIFGRPNQQIYQENFPSDPDGSRCETFCRTKEELYYEQCLADPKRLYLAPGVEEMLEYLKQSNIPYCLATGSGKNEVDFYLAHIHRLSHWFSFDNIIYTDGTFHGKPAPDCYRLAAQRIGISPQQCLVFEDGTSGMRAAMAAKAGALIAIYQEGLPSPITDDIRVDGIYHDFSQWRDMLSQFGL